MRAGKLDKEITILKFTLTEPNIFGEVIPDWQPLDPVRAQIVQATTEEFIRSFGASDVTAIIFRIRWIDGVDLADRVVYAGIQHNIKEIKEIGRRRGLEIRTVSTGDPYTPEPGP